MPWSPLKVDRRFERTCCLHLPGWRISEIRNKHEGCIKKIFHSIYVSFAELAACSMLVTCFAYSSPWRLRQHVLPKRLSTFTGLHSIMSQKTEVFITIAVSTSAPTHWDVFTLPLPRCSFNVPLHRLHPSHHYHVRILFLISQLSAV